MTGASINYPPPPPPPPPAQVYGLGSPLPMQQQAVNQHMGHMSQPCTVAPQSHNVAPYGPSHNIPGNLYKTHSNTAIYEGFEFAKPSHRQMRHGEKPTWAMVTSANALDFSSAEIEKRVKKRRENTKKTVIDEFNNLPSQDMKALVNRLVDEYKRVEPNPTKTWESVLIESDSRGYVTNGKNGREQVRDRAVMRVYIRQVTKPEYKALEQPAVPVSKPLSGSIDLSPNRIFNHGQSLPGMPQGFFPNGAPQGFPGQFPMPPPPPAPLAPMVGIAGLKPPAGVQPVANKNIKTVAGKTEKKTDKSRSGKSRSKTGRKRHDLSDTDSSDSDWLSDANSDRIDNLRSDVRKLTRNFGKLGLNRRNSTSSQLPRVPMDPHRRLSYSSYDRRDSRPMTIRPGDVKMVERFHMGPDAGYDHQDGYSSDESGDDSIFSRPSTDYTPPSSPGGHFSRHKKRGSHGYPLPPLSPLSSEGSRGRRHSRKSLPTARHSRHGSGSYFEDRNPFGRVENRGRRQSEANVNFRAKKQREQRDTYMDEEGHKYGQR